MIKSIFKPKPEQVDCTNIRWAPVVEVKKLKLLPGFDIVLEKLFK